MSSILQRLNETYDQSRKLSDQAFDLDEKRVNLLERLFDGVIIPAAKNLGYEVFLDIARLRHNRFYDKKTQSYPEWKGGDFPDFAMEIYDEMRPSLRDMLFDQLRGVMFPLLSKKDKGTDKYQYPITLRYEVYHSPQKNFLVSRPISDFVDGYLIVDPTSPRSSLQNLISNYQSNVKGLLSTYKKYGDFVAARWYEELLKGFNGGKENVVFSEVKGKPQFIIERRLFGKERIKVRGKGDSLIIERTSKNVNNKLWTKTTEVYRNNWIQSIETEKI